MTVCIEALIVRYFISVSLTSPGTTKLFLPAVKFSLHSVAHREKADKHMKSLCESVR